MATGASEIAARLHLLRVRHDDLQQRHASATDEATNSRVVAYSLEATLDTLAPRWREDPAAVDLGGNSRPVQMARQQLADAKARCRTMDEVVADLGEDLLAVVREISHLEVELEHLSALAKLEVDLGPPATTVAETDVGELAADLEPLLRLAELYVEDETNPPDLRDAVASRRNGIVGELRMHGSVKHDAVVITRYTAFIMNVVDEELGQNLEQGEDDRDATTDPVGAIAAAASLLGDDSTAPDGARAMVDALGEVTGTHDTARDALHRGGLGFLEGDFWSKVVAPGGAVISVGLATGALYIGKSILTRGDAVGAVLRAGRALLRIRYPGIF